MAHPSDGLDLFSAVIATARGIARTLRSDGVSAVLLWGDPAEAEVVYDKGLPRVLTQALSTAAGRALAAVLRREGRPLLVEAAALAEEAPGMAAAMEMHSIQALAVFPLFAEAGIVGCIVVPADEGTDVARARHDWRVACSALAALQLAAAVSALRTLLSEDRRQPAGWADGVLVFDQWERVLFADGFFREFPGWNREDPFGRALNMLPGGVLLTGLKPSHPGSLVWEEHLLPPVSGHGIPVALTSLPLDLDRSGTTKARLVLVRDLRPDEERGPDPSTRLLALGMRVAHASDELLQAVRSPVEEGSGGSGPPSLLLGIEAAHEASALVHTALERVSGGQVPELVDLTELAEDVLTRFAGEFESERIRIFRFMAPEMPGVPGDALSIAGAIRALVRAARNSLRPTGGTLTVRSWAQDGYAWVAVSDDGSGAGLAGDGFKPLFQDSDEPDGSLSRVEGLAQAMGGQLRSETHDRLWNRLTLTLPTERRAAQRDLDSEVARAKRASGRVEGLKVLVVDDNAALRSVLRRYLERRGHAVTEAVDGDDALSIVAGSGFDRVIVDVNMPGKTGPELYDCMREVAPRLCGRTIFMTGGSLAEATEEFIEESGRPSFQKPFDLTEMARMVEKP